MCPLAPPVRPTPLGGRGRAPPTRQARDAQRPRLPATGFPPQPRGSPPAQHVAAIPGAAPARDPPLTVSTSTRPAAAGRKARGQSPPPHPQTPPPPPPPAGALPGGRRRRRPLPLRCPPRDGRVRHHDRHGARIGCRISDSDTPSGVVEFHSPSGQAHHDPSAGQPARHVHPHHRASTATTPTTRRHGGRKAHR